MASQIDKEAKQRVLEIFKNSGLPSKEPKQRFLLTYLELGIVRQAAGAAGISRISHYRWLKMDPDYAKAFELAREMFNSVLEDEAVRRAVHGVKRYKFHQGEPILDPETKAPYIEHEYSDKLLEILLRANMPNKFKSRTEISGEIDHNHSIVVVQDEDWYDNVKQIDSNATETVEASVTDPA